MNRNESTNATTPMHIWKHEVLCAAIAMGADGALATSLSDEIVPAGCPRLTLWFRAGESVSDAAEMLADFAKLRAVGLRADREVTTLRQRLAGVSR